MNKRPMIWNHNRTCVLCRCSKPSAGAITWPKFICAECRPRFEQRLAKRREEKATAAQACST
jgi:hypothetical protein